MPSPAFGKAGGEVFGQVDCGVREALALERLEVVSAEEGSPAEGLALHEHAARAFIDDFEASGDNQAIFTGRENIVLNRAKSASFDFLDRAIQHGIGLLRIDDAVGAVLLEFFDERIGKKHLDAGLEGVVLEIRHR